MPLCVSDMNPAFFLWHACWNWTIADTKQTTLINLMRYGVIIRFSRWPVTYRKKGSDDILVKVLLNERETKLPVKSDVAPYYHWKDVELYYRNKLEALRKQSFFSVINDSLQVKKSDITELLQN